MAKENSKTILPTRGTSRKRHAGSWPSDCLISIPRLRVHETHPNWCVSAPASANLETCLICWQAELCRHATIAAAHTLFASGKIHSDVIEFISTLFGILTARRVPEINNKASDGSNIQNGEVQKGFLMELNFPADPNTEFNSAEETLVSMALGGASVVKIRKTTTLDYLSVVLPSAKSVAELRPDFGAIEKCPGKGIVVTGIAPPESGFDFYSRFFAPTFRVNEDHVCGSAHCGLASLWSKELGKCDFVAYQASPRGGVLNIYLDEQNQRVLLRGKACTVMQGTLLA